MRPMNSLVVATDFSTGARMALERAIRLPLTPDAKLTIIHAVPDDIPGKLRDQAILEATQSIAKQLARVQPLLTEVGLSPTRVVTDVLEGSVIKQLIKRAHSAEADALVIGRHGRRPVLDTFLGGTAQKLIRHSDVPVLVVQGPVSAPYRRVVVAVDLEKGSAKVLKTAARFATDAKVQLLSSARVPFEEFVTLTTAAAVEYQEHFVEEANQALASVLEKTGVDAEPLVTTGEPRQAIIEEGQRFGAELTVIGSAGKKGLKRLLLGSVAEWVLDHAKTDVLVVK
jgi:universal stress protein E